ncbi:hypothetical protein RJ55_04431 [Drechmeria coniospora]|nr:hypothetical protein RJ55_04431 [Drechmeria coniospora]
MLAEHNASLIRSNGQSVSRHAHTDEAFCAASTYEYVGTYKFLWWLAGYLYSVPCAGTTLGAAAAPQDGRWSEGKARRRGPMQAPDYGAHPPARSLRIARGHSNEADETPARFMGGATTWKNHHGVDMSPGAVRVRYKYEASGRLLLASFRASQSQKDPRGAEAIVDLGALIEDWPNDGWSRR